LNKSPTIKGRSRGGKFTTADGSVTPKSTKVKLKGAGKATVAEIEELHGLTVRALIKQLKSGEASAADVGNALKVLNMTGQSDPAKPPKRDSLIDEIPNFSDDDAHNQTYQSEPARGVNFNFDDIPKDT
jgi:hypothetical protein